MPYIAVRMKQGVSLTKVECAMMEGTPSVFIKPEGDRFFINPMTLEQDELDAVIAKLQSIENTLT